MVDEVVVKSNGSGETGLVAKNTAYLTGALVIQKFISFFYFTFIARFTGHSVTGDYVSALAFAGLFAFIADFGLVPVIIREIARDKEHAEKYLNNTLALRLGLSILAFIALIIGFYAADAYVGYLGIEHLDKSLVLIAGLVMILDSFTVALFGVFRGFQKLQFEAIASVINKVVVAFIGVIGILLGSTVTFLLFAILCGSVFNVIFAFRFIIRRLGIRPRFSFDLVTARHLVRMALPFALAALFANVYANFDSVYLRIFSGKGAAGWYAVAYKLTFALQFVPAAFAASLFPAMSEYYISSREKLANLFEKAMYYLMLISLPLSALLFFLSEKIIVLMYKKAFIASVEPFQLLMCALIAVFLNYPVGYLLNACNKQGVNTFNMGIATLVNVLLNLVLIPRYTFNGAAVATLVSSWVLLILGLVWVKSITIFRSGYLWISFAKIAISTFVMSAVLWLSSESLQNLWAWIASSFARDGSKLFAIIKDGAYICSTGILALFTYVVVLWLIRGVSREEFSFVTTAFIHRLRNKKD